jgi:ferredoxin--NADP+ reductase
MAERPLEYNATLLSREDVAPGLAILRVRPDAPLAEFVPGQYATLGLFGSAPRAPGAAPEDPPPVAGALIRRPFSIASAAGEREAIELYAVLVPGGALTPRLFALAPGDRLYLRGRAAGRFTLDGVPEASDAVLVATGTGLAPYMSMVRTHHGDGGPRRYAVVHGVRVSRDLGYGEELRALERASGRLLYLPTVSRPADDPAWRGRTGRVQTLFEDGVLEARLGRVLDPARDHVFLCGHPEMIASMQALLLARGFTADAPRSPGSVHIESYW